MARLSATHNLHGMSTRWRIGLAAIVAAVVIGGFVPHAVLSGADTSGTQVVQIAEASVLGPVGCLDATCGKGSPAPAAPVPGVALAAAIGGIVTAAAAVAFVRRRRGRILTLPAGTRDTLFHPPQFS
jgi:membrane associated rhomboid family serine protease